MRADQWLILGVAGLGVYALYRLSRTSKDEPTEPQEIPMQQNTRQEIPGNNNLPAIPGNVTLPPTVAQVVGNPLNLQNSRAYFGRIETVLPNGQPSSVFQPGFTREQIQDILTNLGFDAVRVYMSNAEAASAISVRESLENPGRGTRWFYGRWLGPDMAVSRPEGLTLLWITRGAPARPNIGFMQSYRPIYFMRG